ncbi:OmpH family outer membrane protein [Solitalea koreensis]|uniref:Periplasmic chaperone for outer membrane proteins Skp n=1 Tax=Solitalea koreensis TaxID=543615 RepID=A0A521CYB5_9SPHI|nr:OmpH family outer membrane protein [Solitalea koreensis]SMO64423.1 periplasmic chaperone for outer membrane proteins Skp [Solitalea koreensis]
MNKNFSTLIKSFFGIAIVAVIVSACDSNKTSNTAKTESSPKKDEEKKSELIVYVNSDSLQKHYNYFTDVKKKLDDKNIVRQQQFESKGRAFQQDVARYQQNAGSLTAEQRQQTEQMLGKRQQEIGVLQQNLREQAAKEEQQEIEMLYNKITEYLKKYSKDHGYKMVISYSKGNSSILYADESLDVTADVLKGLNEEYKGGK